MKPTVHINFDGPDGNIFAIAGIAGRALRRAGLADLAKEMYNKLRDTHSYEEALDMISEYVEID